MNKKAFRAESGLDAGLNNVINVTEPRDGQANDALNVSYFIKKNTVQQFDPTRSYDQFFAVIQDRRLWVSKVAISPGPFDITRWEPLRVDPSWIVVNGTGATAEGNILRVGDYISAYSVNSELTFTLPRTPAYGDTVVIQDEGSYCHLMSIRVLAPTRPFEDGTNTNLFSIPGSMKTFVYSSTGGGRWIVHTSVDKVNASIISRTAQPNQVAAGDMLYRKTSTGRMTIQLPKYAVNGDVVSTTDLDGKNSIEGTVIQIHPTSGHSIGNSGTKTITTKTSGTSDLIFKDNIWNVWDGDIRSRWKPISTSVRAISFDQFAVVGMPTNKTVEITLPKDANDGDYVRLSNLYVVDGLIMKVLVDSTTTHKIVGTAAMYEFMKYKDHPKSYSSVPLNTSITFSNKNLGSIIELYYDARASVWVAGSSTVRVEHVDETNRDRPGVAPLASQAEVDKNHEQSPRDDMIVTPKTLANSVSTETRRGISRIATAPELQVVTSGIHLNDVIVTPKRLNERQSTETIRGVAEVATQPEANDNNNDTHIVTPKKLNARRATQPMAGVVRIISTGAVAATARDKAGQGVYDWADVIHNEPFVITPKTLNQAQATENSRGVAYVGTQSEANSQGSAASDAVMITPKKLDARRATDTMAGIAEVATQAEANVQGSATLYTHMITPKTLDGRRATESLAGIAEIATQVEVDAGTDDTRIVSPKKVKTWMGYDHFTSQTATGIEHTGNLWGKVTLTIRPATETQVGTLRVATQTEANKQGVDAVDNLMITVKKLDARKATESMTGIAEIATQTEVDAEAIHTHIVTPKSLAAYVHNTSTSNATETKRGTVEIATLAETWVGNTTDGSTTAVNSYVHNPYAVSPRGLNHALQNYLPKTAKAVDSDKLDNLDSSQFLRRDIDQTMLGSISITNDKVVEWSRNTDYAKIGFKNTADAELDSHMYFRTGDNGNEYFKWEQVNGAATNELMTLKSDNLRIKGHEAYHRGSRPTPAEIGAYTKAEADTKFVDATGDTMTGTLKIRCSSSHIDMEDSATANKMWRIENVTGTFKLTETSVRTQLTIDPGGLATFMGVVRSNAGFNLGNTLIIESDAKINWNKLKSIPAASITAAGIVKLNNSITSPSQTEAATANTVKILKEMIDEKAGIKGAVMDDLKIRNWIRIGNVILRPNPANKTLDFIWSDDPM